MENSFFQWDSDFVTGNKIIDDQHRSLIMTINELMQLSLQSEAIDDQSISSLQKKLTDYTLEHFNTEEALMVSFSIVSQHKENHEKAHKEFIDNVNQFFEIPENLKNKSCLSEINEFLIRWLAYHILSTDKGLVRQIDRIQEEGFSPEEAFKKEVSDDDANTEPLLKALKALFFLVSQKNKELEVINEGLEEKVRERTRALEEANQRLENLSMVDELTGLPNRRFVMQEIQQLMNHWKRYGAPFSVIFIDLDKFKAVNDDYGHEFGDQVLKWVSSFIRKHIRVNDIFCRIGGDEFVIIAPHCKGDEVLLMAEKLLEIIKNLKNHERPSWWNPSFSLGIVEINAKDDSVSDILNRADSVMYESKRAGGGLATLFSEKKVP
ncbi:bacteriohemerythrin [Anoxynatronum sibiricum]|uniref:Bacteriohemerythrin n=1 Tax=Anoxynatronum sibiricum TaxID=210623 RepID=A0ABU9VNU8_9CLOT